ncbi:hypothetical protein [uncultured Campylobacter sp.]|uniref:hypothetical protein n=1 Tax=uncultured Campylobacter sp. TaxID=218934 RepID=UPI002629D197|nr:hypothetical protein [uncultured Campylobacter sp.]
MNISNLIELIRASVSNEGSTLSVLGFACVLDDLKASYAFFSNDEEEIKRAIKKNAYVIVSEKKIKIYDKDVFYLLVDDLQVALFRLVRFISEEKKLNFVLSSKNELKFCNAFKLNILSKNIFLDFKKLIKANNKEHFFCDDEFYILKLCANFIKLKNAKFELLEQGSLFFTSIICKDLYFKNLYFPNIYAQSFSNVLSYLVENQLEHNFHSDRLKFFKIFFINKKYKLCSNSERALILVFDEYDFDFFKEGFKHVKGFKSALKASLFCDFSYAKLENLSFLNFRYCLLLESEEEVLRAFSNKDEENTLF